MGKVTTNIIKGDGVLAKSDEAVSGLLFDITEATITSARAPYDGGFSSTERIRAITSIPQAKAYGINDNHSDEIKATGGNLVLTNLPITGYVVQVVMEPAYGNKIELCKYTVRFDDVTKFILAQSIARAINARTNEHGYTATGTVYNMEYCVRLVAPAKMGKSINSGLAVYVRDANGIAQTSNITVTQFSGGVGSEVAVLYYHITEFFRKSPNGTLFVGLWDNAGTTPWDADRIQEMQDFAHGTIWQFGAYTKSSVGDAGANIISAIGEFEYAYQQSGLNYSQYCLGILTMDTVTDINTLAKLTTLATSVNLRTAASRNVTFDMGGSFRSDKAKRDGKNASKLEYLTGVVGRSVGTTGAWLGLRSSLKCNTSIAEGITCNLTGNGEYTEGGLSNGMSWQTVNAYSKNLLTTLENNGYLFVKEIPGVAGIYYCTDQNCDVASSDYMESKSVKTIYKAARNCYINTAERVERQLAVDATTGKVLNTSMSMVNMWPEKVLAQMIADGEISGDSTGNLPAGSVVGNDEIVDGKYTITVKVVQTKTLKELVINIGYVSNIS